MVFYAYSKYSKDDVSWRYLITASSLEVLDEWYRAMRKAVPTDAVTRVSPEFYIHDATQVDLGRCTYSTRAGIIGFAPEFMNRMTFTLLNDVGGTIYWTFYNKHVTNHISGNSFFIRSKSDPSVFWYASGNEIYAAKGGRTKFCITGKDLEKGAVMIRGDSISISPIDNRNTSVSVASDSSLVLDPRGADFKFGEFKYGFLSNGWENKTRVFKVRDDGEEWELVA